MSRSAPFEVDIPPRVGPTVERREILGRDLGPSTTASRELQGEQGQSGLPDRGRMKLFWRTASRLQATNPRSRPSRSLLKWGRRLLLLYFLDSIVRAAAAI